MLKDILELLKQRNKEITFKELTSSVDEAQINKLVFDEAYKQFVDDFFKELEN